MNLRARVGLAVLGAACLTRGIENSIDDRAPHGTVLIAAACGQPESLQSVWAEAIASAHVLKATRLPLKTAHGKSSAADFPAVPTAAVERNSLWPDEALSVGSATPGLPGVPLALDNQFWAGRVVAPVRWFTNERSHSGAPGARVGWKAAQAADRIETLDLKLRLADAYVTVLREAKAEQVALMGVARLSAYSRVISNLCYQGTVAMDDLLNSEAALAEVRQMETQARDRLRLASAHYNALLVRPITSKVILEDLTPCPAAGDVDELTAHAFKQRPELVLLAEEARALRLGARSARAAALPSLGVSGGYSALENTYLQPDHVWAVGFVGIWNIFDSSLERHRDRALAEAADAASVLHGEAMDRVSLQVHQAWLGLAKARARLEETVDTALGAEEGLKAARARHSADECSITEVLHAEEWRIHAIDQHNGAVYDAAIAAFRLHRAIGDL